jgi:hypothetical protein
MEDKNLTASVYEGLLEKRRWFTDRAEDAALVTIPALFPQNEHYLSDDFPRPWSGTGAKAVNALSSRLLVTLFPPSSQFFRLILQQGGLDVLAEMTNDPEVQPKVESALFQIEKIIQSSIETKGLRPVLSEILKHLIVSGNALMYFSKNSDEPLNFYPLKQYTVERDGEDNILRIILKETVSQEVLAETMDLEDVTDKTIDVYTVIKRNGKRFNVHQEANGTIIKDTEGSYLEEDLPYVPLRWSRVKGECYGRGHVEEYLGALTTIERLSQSITEAALASSRIIAMVNPNGLTDPEDINDAKNGDCVFGRAEDIGFMQVQKQGDLSIAFGQKQEEVRTVDAAFLISGSNIRNAERVTAQEIQLLQNELSNALGGVFASLSQEFQLPVVKKLYALLVREKEVPPIPPELKKFVNITIVSGIASLDRQDDLQRVSGALSVLQQMLGPQQVAQYLNTQALFRHVFSSAGVSIQGLVKSEEQIAQEQQQAMQAQAAMLTLEKTADTGVRIAEEQRKEAQGVEPE